MKLQTKIFLIGMLILCLFYMPFGYFQVVRILGMLGFGYLAYLDHGEKIKYTPQLFIIFAVIFNPVIKVTFSREIWQVIDVSCALIVVTTIFIEKRLRKTGDVEQESKISV